MNYYSMNLPELAKLLKERKLGDPMIYNELNKIYGVINTPPRQESARQEAIKRLTDYDKNKVGFRKIFYVSLAILGGLAAIATIIGLIIK